MTDKKLHNAIAEISLNHFNSLPKSGKPNESEWTVLSSIVEEQINENSPSAFTVVALGTGSKCIGRNKMCATGTVLNDSHAEVICRRAFLKYIYTEMLSNDSHIVRFDESSQKFKLSESVRFHFFTTHVPCGDAAIFPKHDTEDFGTCLTIGNCLKRAASDESTVTVTKPPLDTNRTGAKCLPTATIHDTHATGLAYHTTGAVRTKPGRGDPTLSVSCSDKLARWCHLGIQGALLSLLLDRGVFLESFTIAGGTGWDEKATRRALYGRLEGCGSGRKMGMRQVEGVFAWEKCEGKRPASASVVYVKDSKTEVSVDGRRQGVTKKDILKNKASVSICKLELFRLFEKVVKTHNITLDSSIQDNIKSVPYIVVKNTAVNYQKNWNILLKNGFKIWPEKNKKYLEFCIE